MNHLPDPDHHDYDDSQWEPLFAQRPLESDAFARSVVNAVQHDRRRRRLARSGWSALAATLMLCALVWFGLSPGAPAGGAYANGINPEDAAIYGEFLEWEAMLTEAEGLIEEENRFLLEMLMVAEYDTEY